MFLDERTGQICKSESIEDELYFILICNEYNERDVNHCSHKLWSIQRYCKLVPEPSPDISAHYGHFTQVGEIPTWEKNQGQFH